MTCPSKTTSATVCCLGSRSTNWPALSGGKSTAGDEVPDRVLLKAVEYLESKAEK